MNVMNKVGLARLVALHSAQAILGAGGAALVTVPGTDKEDFIKGGRALERAWLTLCQNGISMQPMTAITLFWLRWQLGSPGDFLKNHRGLLKNVWKEYRKLFPRVDFSREGHVMLFRFGFGDEITQRTYRKDVESFFVR